MDNYAIYLCYTRACQYLLSREYILLQPSGEKMIIVGIVGYEYMSETLETIREMLAAEDIRVGIFDFLKEDYDVENEKSDILLVPAYAQMENRIKSKREYFDVLMITDRLKDISGIYTLKLLKNISMALEAMKKDGVLIINGDEEALVKKMVKDRKSMHLTDYQKILFGFSKMCSVTTTSVGEEYLTGNLIFSVEKEFTDINGDIVEIGEYKYNTKEDKKIKSANVYGVLASAALLLYLRQKNLQNS